jgi:hypothetical protein
LAIAALKVDCVLPKRRAAVERKPACIAQEKNCSGSSVKTHGAFKKLSGWLKRLHKTVVLSTGPSNTRFFW